MVTVKDIQALKNEDGLTIKNWKPVTYKTGFQVATEGIKTHSAKKAWEAIKAYNGNAGVWYADGVYYVDKSRRISTKRLAVKTGKECNQISILKWKDMSLLYL